jgi:putative transposase
VKYAFIRAQRAHHSLRLLCSTLEVSSRGYYDWLDRPLSKRASDNQRLLTKVRCYHKASRCIYGSPWIQQDLLNDREIVSRQRVARLMKLHNIESMMAKRFVITTNSKQTTSPAPDRLQRRFRTTDKDKTWVSDTTFIRTR